MTDADLTLRDEVAEVLLPNLYLVDGAGGRYRRVAANALADALLPLLARVREEGEARVRERVAAVWPDPFGEFTATEAAAAKLMKDAIRAALGATPGICRALNPDRLNARADRIGGAR